MRILALETSCDDTSVALVADGRRVLALETLSQTAQHAQTGGVVPEAAARLHLDTVHTCLEALTETLNVQGLSLQDIDAVAATLGPGLIGSLLIGANAAKTLALVLDKPFIGVDHLVAHVCSNYLESDLAPPFLCLLVSGGHTQLVHVRAPNEMALLGETLDDAAGEAYDKIGRLMGLPFPGGPAIDALAQEGDALGFSLPIARTERPWDFSFSGLKTATARHFEQALARGGDLQQVQRDLSAAFQHTVVETLFRKTTACARALGLDTLALCGGVSANRGLRERFQAFARESGFRLYLPAMAHCTDNAAMVASAAYFCPLTRDPGHEVYSRPSQLAGPRPA